MTRKYAFVTGNVLMAAGLLVMVLGVVCSVLNQLSGVNLSGSLIEGAIFAIFIGAMLWLAGARLSGREKVADRYFWLRHYGDERCRRHHSGH
ncbi:hypothetical protein BL250_10920 [Erwinia sp. OLTSP20]|uniref:stress-induced protein YchH n=1 Tax=unclassified Erwinia TaxID=2622719 RepID=UPI000C19868E|nr:MULTISPECIES: stress-induced protein YchH [unclassified Erwinia]PIJ49959.1 hypothetical protein BV501_10600 [Erwinia sp. OAMSP11]PIJ71393.1 hypothetical protein BK416_11795 [Erwinia sp. OLSSP12]PIJ80627.1 hypothetical protein BLD47_10690 [Erwinia sp. OLCASP19]PIJ82776.1 hypothetical protein BLD46_10380 [Erwinia sp. OLMTSP26]PIJ85462.1 hypothetical protein BLD49_10570 [Erwinia sp. OLMDSP33]